jgi:hypothetical protein
MRAPKQAAILHRFKPPCQFASEKVLFGAGEMETGGIDGPCRIRTYNQRIMHTTTAFAAL